jgi:hypothetical protein
MSPIRAADPTGMSFSCDGCARAHQVIMAALAVAAALAIFTTLAIATDGASLLLFGAEESAIAEAGSALVEAAYEGEADLGAFEAVVAAADAGGVTAADAGGVTAADAGGVTAADAGGVTAADAGGATAADAGGGLAGEAGAADASGGSQLEEAFHYTSQEAAVSIARTGLAPGSYATPAGNLSPLQAQLELALNPTRALPNAVVRIDVAGLREAGFEIPEATRVSNVVSDPITGRVYTMPGGGWQLQFPDSYTIPTEFLKAMSL